MKKALVCGAGGFIGGHLVKKLKNEGYWVRAVDQKEHEFAAPPADEFRILDLRKEENCVAALTLEDGQFDEVYQLAADMGGVYSVSRYNAATQDLTWRMPGGPGENFPVRVGYPYIVCLDETAPVYWP